MLPKRRLKKPLPKGITVRTGREVALARREKFIAEAKDEFKRQEQLHILFKEGLRPLTAAEKVEVNKYLDHLEHMFMGGLREPVDKREMEIRWKRNHPRP